MEEPSLVDVVARYVEAAIPIAMANLQPGELIGLPGAGRWKATGPGQFQREETTQLSWVVAIHKRESQLHALPQYQQVVAVIQANEDWRRQFGTLVGTHWSRTRLDLDWFLDGCLSDALTASAEGRNPAAAAAERAEAMVRFLESSQLPLEIFGPLFGFNAADVGRIELASDVAIEPIDENEVERLYSIGLLYPTMPQFPFITAPSHLARTISHVPKVVGEADPPADPQVMLDTLKPAEEAIEDVLVCLRLFKAGQVGLGGRATLMPTHIGRAWHTSPARFGLSPHIHASYTLHADEIDDLHEIWSQLHSVGTGKTKQLTLAARRFAYKGERGRVDDQLVDLIVAAEALFLGEKDEETRGELRFRLSSRAASFIVDPTRDKRSIYRIFLAAYVMRSRLVHGGEAKPANIGGDLYPPERMVDAIEALLRLALKQALREASSKSTRWAVDWESLLFPASAGQPSGPNASNA